MPNITELNNSNENSVAGSDRASATMEEEINGDLSQDRTTPGSDMPRDEFTAFGEMVAAKVRGLHRDLRSAMAREILKSLESAAEISTTVQGEELRHGSTGVPMSSAASSASYERQLINSARELEAHYIRQVRAAEQMYNNFQPFQPPQGPFNGCQPPCMHAPPQQMPYNGSSCYVAQIVPALLAPYVPNQPFAPGSQMVSGPAPSYGCPIRNPMPTGNFGYPIQMQRGPGPMINPACPIHNPNFVPSTILPSLEIPRGNQSGMSE